MTALRRQLCAALERVERVFDAAFGVDANPLKQLGALGWFFYWIVVASGVYLYIFFDTGITEAYQSIDYMTHRQWYAAGVMRSFHRYASDALIVVMALHLAREFLKDKYRGVRWFAWVTGVALIWFVYASGISGYWLVWDQLAQYIALATSEWLDALGVFGEPIARNFVHDSTLSGRFFTLMVFIHIAVPLFLLFLMWIHTHRLAQAKVNPPRALAGGTLTMLVVLSLIKPALSHAPAELSRVPAELGLDWFYLIAYPLFDHYSLRAMWALLLGASVVMALLPWLPRRREAPAALVDLENCNGCRRCFVDCPYSAISMVARSDGRSYEEQAQVNADLCIACGICVGSCPTATPYRSHGELRPGIDLPGLPLTVLHEQAMARCKPLEGSDRVLVYACEHGPRVPATLGVATVVLPCIGALPPSFIDYLIMRKNVDGVLLAGCRANDCDARLGLRWTEERLARERDPRLRGRVPDERIATCWAGTSGAGEVADAVRDFKARLRLVKPVTHTARPARSVGLVQPRETVDHE